MYGGLNGDVMRGVIGGRKFVAFWFLVAVGAQLEFEVTDRNLQTLLSQREWESIVGRTDADASYTITRPRVVRSPDRMFRHVEIEAPELRRNFVLELLPAPELLAEGFQFLETFGNGTSFPLRHDARDTRGCYYRSERAALDLCQGVRGLVHSDPDEYYVIHPLPDRFHRETPNRPHVLVRKSHKPHRHDGDTAAAARHCPHDATQDEPTKSNETESGRRRGRRNANAAESPVFVETAVFVDRDLFDHMKTNFPLETERELIRFILAMINAVQLLYHDPSLGRPVNFVLKRLEILKEEAAGLSRPPDIDKFLSSFCNWQRNKNPVGDREPQHWDHALILTGLDLYVRGKHGKISSQVVGLAPVAGMCTPTSSCTVNEGRHFESVYVVAHEIGHNLGMRHDGPSADNDCDPTSYIMSPTLGSGKITWSSCSRRYLQKFLETTQSRCLLDHGSSAGQLDHSAEGALPGERFDADQQCMLKYGRGSKHSTQQPLDDVCRDLHCERERYTWTSHPALEGTNCGLNLWCTSGRCVSKTAPADPQYNNQQSAPPRTERTDGGWSSWKQTSECASSCLYGDEGRLRSGSTGIMISKRSCTSPRPQGGGRQCEGPETKYQACTAQQCFNVPRMTVRNFAEQYCTRAKQIDKDLTGVGLQKISTDPEEACVIWCQKRNGSTKSRGWTFPDGTACQVRRSRYGKATYCIKGRCEEFACDDLNESQFVQMPELCPVEQEDNEISWRIGLRRRDTYPHWKSASGCHFNCVSPGSGIRLVVMKGKNTRSSIQLCQPDQFGCGRMKSPFQHASTICTKYKDRVRRLSGLGMQISPALEDPDRSCRVACQDENISHRFYLVNGEEGWFPFGTDCARGTPDKKAYCISGKCLEFGSDDTPLSESEFSLPLLSRTRRSLQHNSTKVTAILQQQDLDEIVDKLNQTILGSTTRNFASKLFEIDLDNPIHLNVDEHVPFFHNHSQAQDYINYT